MAENIRTIKTVLYPEEIGSRGAKQAIMAAAIQTATLHRLSYGVLRSLPYISLWLSECDISDSPDRPIEVLLDVRGDCVEGVRYGWAE